VEKNWPFLTTTTTKTMEVKYFEVKHKVLKNSSHGQIWANFEKMFFKMSGKAFKKGQTKFLLGKYQSCMEKSKITKVNFLINFVRLPPPKVKQKIFV
jgi:hypothetical protein